MKWPRWISAFRRDRNTAEDELRRELEAHFEGSVELLVRRGWGAEAARREVHRRFGDEAAHVTALRRLAVRRARRRMLRRLYVVLSDSVRAGWRDVRRSPGLSAGVIVVLVVGIGVNGAIFRVVDRLLLSPPPHIDDASRVVRLHQTVRYEANPARSIDSFTYAEVSAMRSAAGGAQIGAAVHMMPETMGEGDDAVRVRIARVDSAYHSLLGVRAARGRAFLAADHQRGAAPVALLGHGLWSTRFGGDVRTIGRTIRLGRGEYEVIGVMPKGFAGAQAPATDVWLPLEPEADALWGAGWREDPRILAFRPLARLPDGVAAETWAARLEPALRLARDGDTPPGELVELSASSLVPGSGPDAGPIVSVSRWLTGVSLLVLLVACANAANLLLAHGERRRRALAVRTALGAGAGVIRLELLARSLLLAVIGGIVAFAVAAWGGAMLENLFLDGMELPTRPATARLLGFVGSVALLASILSGLAPALRAPRSDVRLTIERGGRVTGGGSGVRRALLGVQVALSMLLLVGAGLFIGSFRGALEVDLGFDHERLLMIRLEQDGSETPRARLYEEAASRVNELPDVASSTTVVGVPFVLLYGLSAGLPGEENVDGLYANAVGPDFFRTMGIEMLRGRPLEAGDMVEGARFVAVVSARAADHLWPGQNPVGRCLAIGEGDSPCSRVVGVAAEHAGVSWAPGALLDPGVMQAWVPIGHPEATEPAALLVRTTGGPGRALERVRRAAGEVPDVRYVEAALMSDFVGREMRAWRLGATVFSLFGVIALVVAAAGLYGVIAFEVAQRRREFGVRVALGADRLRVMRPVVGAALPAVLGGVAAGALIAAAGGVRIGDLLYRTSPFDPAIFASAAGVLMLTAAAALLVPAWRAGGVDPREALGEE